MLKHTRILLIPDEVLSRRSKTLLAELFNISTLIVKHKQIDKHMDELEPRTTKYAINVCSTVIYIVIYIVFDILSDIIMLLCIEELLI